MLISSFATIKIIFSKNIEINPVYGLVKCTTTDENKQVIYSHSITLTPGTMTIAIKDNQLMVHSLNPDSLISLRNGDLEKYILQLESK